MKKIALRPLAEQVIVITGASSGIGLVTAKRAAARGARVMLVARSGDALAAAVREIEAAGGIADHAVADVGDRAQVEAAAARAIARFGRIDTWVNGAGVAIYARLVDTPDDEHERMMRTNYFGTVHGCLVAIGRMRETGGALISIGSIGSDVPSAILSAYTATKFAVKAYVSALRTELNAADAPIAVTLIKPSGVATPIAERSANHIEGEARIPVPLYDPEVVARAILDAAENVRRDVTVGGLGRATVLLGTHFPRLLERMGGLAEAVLIDHGRAPTRANALAAPLAAGRERSSSQTGRGFSLYTAAKRHPRALRAATLAAALAVGGLVANRRARSSRRLRPGDATDGDAAANGVPIWSDRPVPSVPRIG